MKLVSSCLQLVLLPSPTSVCHIIVFTWVGAAAAATRAHPSAASVCHVMVFTWVGLQQLQEQHLPVLPVCVMFSVFTCHDVLLIAFI